MALQLGALRAALDAAGVSPDLSRKAAEEAAGLGSRLTDMEGKIRVLAWMVGFNLLLTISIILVKLFHG